MADDEAAAGAPSANLGSRRGVAKAAAEARARAIEDADVVKMILSTPAGRRWYCKHLHGTCGLYSTTANAAFDANGQHFKEGARAVGLVLHEEALQYAKPQYMVALAENLP